MEAITMVEADPARDKAKLLELEHKIFSTDRFDAWDGYTVFFVVLGENIAEPVGSIAFVPNLTIGKSWDEDAKSPGTLWLVSIGILPEFQGRGIGTDVMRWATSWFRELGFHRLTSNFRVSNLNSRSLHKKCGFQFAEVVPNYYHDPTEHAQVVVYQP